MNNKYNYFSYIHPHGTETRATVGRGWDKNYKLLLVALLLGSERKVSSCYYVAVCVCGREEMEAWGNRKSVV
jgi:hypothetical protein